MVLELLLSLLLNPPVVSLRLRIVMVIAAALIEGFTFAAIGVFAYGFFVASTFSGASDASSGSSHAQLDQPAVEKQVSEVA